MSIGFPQLEFIAVEKARTSAHNLLGDVDYSAVCKSDVVRPQSRKLVRIGGYVGECFVASPCSVESNYHKGRCKHEVNGDIGDIMYGLVGLDKVRDVYDVPDYADGGL
jgi:hypothetical protein